MTKLFNELQEVEKSERDIEQNLEYIEAQQNELESALETYSAQVSALVSQDASNPNSTRGGFRYCYSFYFYPSRVFFYIYSSIISIYSDFDLLLNISTNF